MLTQSKEVQNAWRASQRTLDIKVTIDGKTYGATDVNSLKYDSGAYSGDTFAIGSTYSNTVQIEFSHLIEGLKLGMEVRPSIGIKTSSGYVYEPLGVFIISSEIKMDRNNNLTTVSASDRFCCLEGAYVSKLTYPAKVLDVIAEICAQSGVKANTDDLARLPHQADLPAPITGQSYRKALGWIAQLYVGYALFDRQGLFTIRTISEPNYELDPSQYEQAGLTKNEAAYKINGIQCQVTLTTKTRDGESTEETKNYQAGDATGSQIKLENNIMTPQRLNDIWEQLKDLTFYPFSLNWFGNPAVEAGDWLWLEDKQGNSFVVPNSSYTLDFNGGLSATSKADQTTSSDQMVPWQGSVAQVIKELQARRSPDGTVVFPPSVTAPPTNAKFNDVWFKKNGNSTELWIFEKQDDGSGKWIRKDLSDDEIKKKVADAQQGLNQAKADIINNKQKADADIENLNKSIEDNKKATDQDIQSLNESIEANKKVADESLQKLNNSVTNLQGQYDNNVVPNLNKVIADASDALQKYISAQNSIADLTKQAQEQGKDIADVTNTVKGLNINYANLVGDVNSTKVDVKGLQTTVGTANGDIAQLKLDAQNLQAMLAGKVDNTAYTNFVNLTNQALNARLTASDLNGYAKTVDVQATANGLRVDLNSVTDRMNNLKIGGRNLLHNTSDQYRTLTNDGAWLQKTTASTDMTSVANYHSGDRFTYAATVTNTSNQPVMLEFQNCGQDKQWLTGIQSSPVPVGAKDYRVAVSLPVTEKTYYLQTWLIFQGGKGVPGEQIQVKDERLVFGTISNTWSPNPEDVAQNITELSSRITANSQQFSSYYTKTETDTRTNSVKNDTINTIKNDSNWQGLNNILTNSGFLQTAEGFTQKVQQTTMPMFKGGGVNLQTGTDDCSFPFTANLGKAVVEKYDSHTNMIHAYGSYSGFYLGYNSGYFIPDVGETYTFSADIKGKGSIDGNYFKWEGSDSTSMGTITLSNNWQRIRNTIHISQNKGTWIIYPTPDGSGVNDFYIKHIKIERGSVDTPWSPNPADLATQLSFTELTQTVNGLQTTVNNDFGNLKSQISQTATAIRGELSNQITGVQNKITSTADGLNVQIANLKIGARNLLHNTSDKYQVLSGENFLAKSTASETLTSVANYHSGDWFTYAATITNNSSYPVTLETWLFGKGGSELDGNTEAPYPLATHSVDVSQGEKNKQVSTSFQISGNTYFVRTYVIFHNGGAPTGSEVLVKDERLLEGKYSGAWSPNPEDISQNITEINATIQGLQSTVSNNYGNLQSQISQSSTTIRTELTDKFNNVQNQITTTANGLNAKLTNLRVGGRNLLHNTSDKPKSLQGSGWLAQSTASDIYTSTANYHGGDEFTYSALITNNSSKPVTLETWLFKGREKGHDPINVNSHSQVVPPHAQNQRVSTTFAITAETYWIRTYVIYSTGDGISSEMVNVSEEQLEEGNIRTPWTPNPDDTAQSIVELGASLQGLQTKVSDNYGQLQSLNAQTATTIRNEVTDKVNNLQGQITTQANNLNLKIGTASDLSNICRNPTFDNHDGWTDSVHVESNWSEIPTKNAGVLFERDGYYGDFFTVSKGEKYYFSVFGHNGSQYAFCLGLQYLLNNGEYSWQGASWIQSGETKTAEGRLVVPNNAVSARVWVSLQGTSNLGWVRFTNVIVKKNDTLAQINMSAGTTLIQNDKIYMDSSSTIFSGKAFIPSAAITSLTADKITAGTINGAKVNVINLNANNITAGTLKGSNGEFYLDSGSLHVWQGDHNAWIDKNGIHDSDNSGNNVWISNGSISAYGNSSGAYLFDGGLYLHKSQSLSDAVLNPNYGSITKSDNIVSFGTSGLDIDGKDGFLLRTHGWNDQTLAYLNGNEIIGAGIAGKSDGFMNIAAKKQLFLYAGEPVQNDKLKTIPKLVLDGTYQNGQTALKGTFSQYFFQGPSSGFSGGITLQDEFVNVGSLNGKNYFSISNDGAISITANGKSILSLNGLFPGVNGDFNVSGNFTVTGSKNAVVPTSRGMAAINAYETAEYYFGDIGETQTNSNGVVTVMIDPYFLETVNTLVPYQVFLTPYGNGNVWVSSRSANNFTVKSSKPNIHFVWEIKAKRKGYENDRMKIVKGVFNNEQY
ncbi:hypothetical protein [Limosilactobacillus reuteri]|uniref:hypothetical protein n=1 Tax=Limosilactobacillus reuteri TaxID=1598 RepID=UPI002B056CFD|nr:hypothetical protein [Limosilactobacillus reuteri]